MLILTHKSDAIEIGIVNVRGRESSRSFIVLKTSLRIEKKSQNRNKYIAHFHTQNKNTLRVTQTVAHLLMTT